MKREIIGLCKYPSPCCPGHDKWPNDTYSCTRSKNARSRDKKREHRFVRRKQKLACIAGSTG